MSDAVSGFSALPLMQQTALSDKAVLFDPPESLAALPFATEIPALILPAGNGVRQPVLQIVTDAGETVSIPVRPPFLITRPLRLNVRVLPNDAQNAVTFKMLFPTKPRAAPDPVRTLSDAKNVRNDPPEQAVRPPAAAVQPAVPETPPVAVEGFVMRSVPDKLAELFPDLVPPKDAMTAAPGISQVFMELTPDDNAVSAFGERPSAAPADPIAPATPTPAREADVVPNIVIKMPEADEPAPKTAAAPEKPASPAPDAAGKAPFPAPSATQPTTAADPRFPVKPDAAAKPSEPHQPFSAVKTPAPSAPPAAPQTEPAQQNARPAFKPDAPKPEQPQTQPLPAREQPVRFETGAAMKGVVYKPESSLPALIATKAGVVAAVKDIPLPHMTPVVVKITALAPPPELSDIPEQDTPVPFKNPWTVLSHALETLQAADVEAFEEMIAVLPKAGDKLPALMMNFMSAATRSVPFTAWLGEDVVAALRKTEKGERLLRRLEKEFSAEPKKATDRSGSAWKGWNVPVLSGSVVEPVSLYLQRPPQDDNNAAASAKSRITGTDSVRFVLDLRLSRLGKLQLEGLAHRKNKTFNLTVRHTDDLPASFETDIRTIFTNTLDALAYAGTVRVLQTDDFIDFSPADDPQQGVWA